ncbi:hypothetical protein HDU93_004991 [Gonapodya sp. JEL0774]|nr:hypothetical protein HDU93_004991 [Gonapodya sp. JEL0774]
MMYQTLLNARIRAGNPVKVGLIGAGKFGSMFLNQVPTTPGLVCVCIADLSVDRAKLACAEVGWSSERITETVFVANSMELFGRDDVEVVVEATGDPAVGIAHAKAAIKHKKHIVMVNVEADVLAGPLLAQEARSAGIVYSLAYGDQPALVCELVDWARSCGFDVVCAGKGTKYLPEYHAVTPSGVWEHYGIHPEEAKKAGMNSQMFNSFLDGTKSAIEMTAISNATGLLPPSNGLLFPPCSADDLPNILRPQSDGGVLDKAGTVEVVSSLFRDGSQVPRDLRWGVYVVLKASNEYARSCFKQYGMKTDESGWYASQWKPYHLIGLELNISIFSAALFKVPTGQPLGFIADVVSIAKRNLAPGDMLDGEGGFTVWGKVVPATTSLSLKALPIGLAHGVKMAREVTEGGVVSWEDVDVTGLSGLKREAVDYRRRMEVIFGVVGSSNGGVQ